MEDLVWRGEVETNYPPEGSEMIREIPVADVTPNPYQPRREFNPDKLRELTASIREKGVIQPVVVRPKEGKYELIAGERRLRAAQEIGLEKIPAVIRDVSDGEALEIALIENIQREELNPIDEAEAYRQLINEFTLTQEELGKKVGKDRSTITNFLRLLNLPLAIQDQVADGMLSMGHARALLPIPNEAAQMELSSKIIKQELSVRKTEELVRKLTNPDVSRETVPAERDPNIIAIEEEITESLGTKVTIKPGKDKGRIEIEYYSADDLERLIERLRG
ncbi:MAG: ParB/RepB/Spo0J family partition protein [bacterium]|nr:ParB/RepB/Spo0J family partition protein [bacterium]